MFFRPYQDETLGDSFYLQEMQDGQTLLPFQNFTLSSSKDMLFAGETISEVKNEDELENTPIQVDIKSNFQNHFDSMDINSTVFIKKEPLDEDIDNNGLDGIPVHDSSIYQVLLHPTQ